MAQTPNDLLLPKTKNVIGRKPDRGHGTSMTTKMKNMFVNHRERENLMSACANGDVDAVTHLLTYTKPHLNPDLVRDSKLRTPLLVACAGGKTAVVQELIRFGADVNNPLGDVIGNRPLDLAVVSNNVDTVLALLEAGAQVFYPCAGSQRMSNLRRTPLSLAQSRLDLLLHKRSSSDTKTSVREDQVVKIVQLLKYFVPQKTTKSLDNIDNDKDNSSSNEDPATALDALAAKLSTVHIDSDDAERSTDEVMKSLQDVISKLKI